MEVRVLVGEDVGLDVAERRVRLMLDPIVEGLDDVLLEMRRAGIGRDHGLALRIREFLVGDTEHVHLDASGDEGDDRVHVHGDTRRRVQRDRGPDELYVALRDFAGLQEVARGVRAVDLEALGSAAVPACQAHVVEHRAGVEQLAVELQATPQAGQRAKIVNPARIVEEQFRLGITDKLRDLLAQLAVGDADPFDRRHGAIPSVGANHSAAWSSLRPSAAATPAPYARSALAQLATWRRLTSMRASPMARAVFSNRSRCWPGLIFLNRMPGCS